MEDSNFNFIKSEHWYILLVTFLYNFFDVIGKFAGCLKAFDLEISTTNFGSVARIVFIATFLLTDF